MSIEIDFSGKYSFEVQVSHDEHGSLGRATLRFGAAQWPSLSFGDWEAYGRLGGEKKHHRLIAMTNDGDAFSLFGCEVSGFYVSIDYVVAGDVVDGFNSIGVRFDDVNEWFMPFRKIEDVINSSVDSDGLSHIDVEVDDERGSFNLKTETIRKINQKKEDFVVSEYVRFNLKGLGCRFSIDEISGRVSELSNLFSILIAIPLHVVSVVVTSEDERCYFVFFSTFRKPERDASELNRWDYFARKPLLDGRWKTVLDNYYRSEYRKISWARLAGMQRYEGFWEYRTLGYVSLLDKYVGQRTAGKKRSPSTRQALNGTKVHDSLRRIVPKLTEKQEMDVFSAISEIFLKSGVLSFGERYRFVLGAMNDDVRGIINLKNEDFSKIKEIRDAVAHGDALDLVEGDYWRIGFIVSKVALLLTYWAFLDFGLNDADFLSCLNSSHSNLHRRAGIDGVRLARVLGSAGFYRVSKGNFDAISNMKNVKSYPCFLLGDDGGIEYSEEHASALRDWHFNPKPGEIPWRKIFGCDKENVKYWAQAYIEDGSRRLELTQAYFTKIT